MLTRQEKKEIANKLDAARKEVRDIKERLNQLNEQKEQAFKIKEKQEQEISSHNDEIKKLILIAFHDIKASIVAIQGLLESFTHENEPLFNERAKFYLGSMKNRLHFTERLARDVVDFTRIGMFVFPTEKVNLNEIILTLGHELGQRLKEKRIILKTTTELPVIYASRERFTRVYYNLLDNAIKYGHGHGLVRLSGQRRDDKAEIGRAHV